MEPQVLFEDNQLLVIDKPAGMVVNDSVTTKDATVQAWVRRYLKWEVTCLPARQGNVNVDNEVGSENKSNFSLRSKATPRSHLQPLTSDFVNRNGIVHRLDKETSGVLVIAKTPEAFSNLQAQFKERGVEKSYVALVHGEVEPTEGVINAPVGRLPWNRERFGVLPGGRAAETSYKVISQYSIFNIQYSLVELFPKTGRTHQLRVHLKSIGHPVVSDEFYAGRKIARNDRKWCPRLFLHAKSISFAHPKTGERMEVASELAIDLQQALALLSREG